MKKFIYLIPVFALIATLFFSFAPPAAQAPILVEVLESSSNGLTVDTIAASETVYFPITNAISGRYEYAFSVHADSLSGGPDATVTLEMQTCWACDDWSAVGTAVTINGTSTDGNWTGVAYGVDYRLKVVASGTTQSNRVEAFSVFKEL